MTRTTPDRGPLRVLLICHHDAPIHLDGIARWLSSWATVTGMVVIQETAGTLARRIRREAKRSGLLRFLDVLAFRLLYRLRYARSDAAWLSARLETLRSTYDPLPAETLRLTVASPNSKEAQDFIATARPDLIVALCKNILAERIFSLGRHGTVVFHPGICPEYRNAHGCFWALANDDLDRVGMTVLRIDKGIDTGPVLGYFRAQFDEVRDSHVRIQQRMVLDNLNAIQALLVKVSNGTAAPIDVSGRQSHEWGQPWFTAWRRWKSRARRRQREAHRA